MTAREDSILRTLWRLVLDILRAGAGGSAAGSADRDGADRRGASDPRGAALRDSRADAGPAAPAGAGPSARSYPGDFTGRPAITYRPHEDGRPDPGEVVWTWVPFEEDHSQGKDRPVLLIGADGPWLLGVQMTSKDHDRDAAQEASVGRYWMDIGSGPWDRQGRPSEVRLNRILRVDPATVRRTAARLDERRFRAVADGVLAHC